MIDGTDISNILNTFLLIIVLNPLSASPTKWSNTLKQFVGKLPTNCLSVFGHFVNLALKGLTVCSRFTLRKVSKIMTFLSI